jgi:hypothetical protein
MVYIYKAYQFIKSSKLILQTLLIGQYNKIINFIGNLLLKINLINYLIVFFYNFFKYAANKLTNIN